MKNKKTLISIGAIVLLVAVLAGAYLLFMPGAKTKDASVKSITVTVIHGDKTEKAFTYETTEETLGAVITSENLVSGTDGEYGLYITQVDGETADESKQQWWCITKGGEQVNTSADTTPIADGEQYELTMMEGY